MPAQALQFLRRMGGRSPLRPLLLRSGLLASRALQKCTAEATGSARIGSRLPAREKRNLKNAIAAGPRRRARARARRGVRRPGAGRAVDGHEGVLERPQGAPAVAARPAERLLRPAEPRDDDLRLGAAGRGGAASASYLAVPRCCGAFTPSSRVAFQRGGRGWFLFRF